MPLLPNKADTPGHRASTDRPSLITWMASSEVDQKALGNFAAVTSLEHPSLSAMLYKILGLSVMLSNKLLRARRLRRLDPTRETKSLQLYYHIIWLSREGLLILEEFVLPLVDSGGFIGLKILAFKLRASFYHIFVLFHNRPAVHSPGIASLSSSATVENEGVEGGISSEEKNQHQHQHQHQHQSPDPSLNPHPNSRLSFRAHPEILSVFPTPPGAAISKTSPKSHSQTHLKPPTAPPGLTPVQQPTPYPNRLSSSSFLLPALDYTPTATACFNHASLLADRFLPGSHPLRLSIKLEYAAYLHDCLQDPSASRKLAKQAIADVYNAQEGMDDESFEDAAEIVGLLGKMVKRGDREKKIGKVKGTESPGTGIGVSNRSPSVSGTPSRTGGSGTGSVTPRAGDAESSRSEGGRTPTSTRTTVRKTSPRTAATTPIPSQSPRTPKISHSVSVSRGGHSGSPAAVPHPSMLNPI